MKVGIDLVSGESSLELLIKGSFDALNERKDLRLVYFGNKESYYSVFNGVCRSEYEKFKNRIEVVDAPEIIEMNDDPLKIVKQKKESSIIKGIQYHKDGKIDAFFSPGNTGAIVVASSIMLGRIKGIKKPALASAMPTVQGNSNLLLDVGASAECEADDLLKFAIMGDIYAREVMGIEKPKIGLLNIGEEEHKGNKSIKEAYKKFSEYEKIDFHGNVEGYEIFTDIVQVIVCDGYIGNIALKVAEGTAKAINLILKQSIKSNPLAIISLPLYMGALKNLKEKMDPEKYGGAPLLGVNGNIFIGHGKSGRDAIKYGILVAARAIDHNVLGKLTNGMKDLS
ncbi:MAG: phosphate acyltransferase PlsX [Brevinematales bacterium]|nr:phosphate acyltransferase PlsX [Brevinematales bacterium]